LLAVTAKASKGWSANGQRPCRLRNADGNRAKLAIRFGLSSSVYRFNVAMHRHPCSIQETESKCEDETHFNPFLGAPVSLTPRLTVVLNSPTSCFNTVVRVLDLLSLVWVSSSVINTTLLDGSRSIQGTWTEVDLFSEPVLKAPFSLIGAAVDSRAYFPIAFEIAARGWLVVIVQQTARISFFFADDANAVLDSNDTAFAQVPASKWAIGGHSAGGSGASAFALKYPSKVCALVMQSGGLAGNLNGTGLPVVNIVGALDKLAELAIADPAYKPVDTIWIEGANHYQVGDYGYQVPDNIATISQDEQQSQFAQATVNYLGSLPPRGSF
jgi:predicted alpha/beta-hydrolase family hydrolase